MQGGDLTTQTKFSPSYHLSSAKEDVSVATVILWARDVVGSSGVTDAGALLKPPDGSSSDPSAGFVTLKRFEGGFYPGLPSLP